MAGYRIETAGHRLDRSKTLKFSFDGVRYQGFQGDSLASALLAQGKTLFGRSFKYHRPRGVLAAGIEEPNALIQLERGAYSEPNIPAPMIRLYENLISHSQNRWPSLVADIGSVNSLIARFIPSGFYYKTYMWPAQFWEPVYEKIIRQAAGLGKAPTLPDPSHYGWRYHHCDVLVAGGGLTGLTAALTAARQGKSVVIGEQMDFFGGWVGDYDQEITIDGLPAQQAIKAMVAELSSNPNVLIMANATVSAAYDENYLLIHQRLQDGKAPKAQQAHLPRHRLWKIRAGKVIVATGALERPFVFANNDLPGVMLAGAISSYIRRYGVVAGKRIVFFGNHDGIIADVLTAHQAGAEVWLVDSRPSAHSGLLASRMAEAGIAFFPGQVVAEANGRQSLREVTVRPYHAQSGRWLGEGLTIACDAMGMSAGYTPSAHLFSQARGKLAFDSTINSFRPQGEAPWPMDVVGAANGTFGLSQGMAEAVAAIPLASKKRAKASMAEITVSHNLDGLEFCHELTYQPQPISEIPSPRPGLKSFHEFQNDATAEDVRLAAREGYRSVEHFKRYTTTGMATDQGKTSGVNGIAILSKALNTPVEEVGHTTFRPPWSPLTFGAIAGAARGPLFQQARVTAMMEEHVKDGALFEDVGDWKRPHYFPRAGESMEEAVARECATTRQAAGMVDASTLGKIDIEGRDAVKFLNMLYPNQWSNLAIGRCRYGVMCNDHGMVFDDGVTSRLGEQHFHMTTTTGGAARVFNWLEEWLQTEWPDWDVRCTSVTEQWSVASLNGPKARAILQPLTNISLANEDFPFMSWQNAQVAGIPARIFRITFAGELGYEINVPARYGLALWRALKQAGEPHGMCLYGTESLHVLRAEKGYIIVGQDSDGTATPQELGLGWMISPKKEDFLGKRAHSRSGIAIAGRKQLVGLLCDTEPQKPLREGAHLVNESAGTAPLVMQGHVTSSYYSPNVGRAIAMAMVKDGLARLGQTLYVPELTPKGELGKFRAVTLVKPVFFDSENARQNGVPEIDQQAGGLSLTPAIDQSQFSKAELRTPLAQEAPLKSPKLSLRELPMHGKITLRGNASELTKLDDKYLSQLPQTPLTSVVVRARDEEGGRVEIQWQGPSEWLIRLELDQVDSVMAEIKARLQGAAIAGHVTEVSDYYTDIRIQGEAARDLLSCGIPLDLRPSQFTKGMVAGSHWYNAAISLRRDEEAEDDYRLSVRWSFAPYLWQHLAHAAREWTQA